MLPTWRPRCGAKLRVAGPGCGAKQLSYSTELQLSSLATVQYSYSTELQLSSLATVQQLSSLATVLYRTQYYCVLQCVQLGCEPSTSFVKASTLIGHSDSTLPDCSVVGADERRYGYFNEVCIFATYTHVNS